MHPIRSLLFVLVAAVAALILVPLVSAADDHGAGQLVPVTDTTDAAWLAKARASYPLKTCSVSGDQLGGGMGKALDFVYKQSGKPDRLVRFCCKDCVKDFNKEPAKYLKAIDDAALAGK